MKTKSGRDLHLPALVWLLVLGTQLLGCHDSPPARTAPTPAEQQKLKDEQAKTQKEMNTLTSGMGESLSKTPAAPVTHPQADWKKCHSQRQSLTTKPRTQSQSPAPSSSFDKSKP